MALTFRAECQGIGTRLASRIFHDWQHATERMTRGESGPARRPGIPVWRAFAADSWIRGRIFGAAVAAGSNHTPPSGFPPFLIPFARECAALFHSSLQ
ncbi:hypothetical protein F01_410211 [Burkholderia cenocepacia]|nr:hypothetical protein F01_410211 [Burkholderia cenocepacia]